MERSLWRRWRATRPWVVLAAAVYALYFGGALAVLATHYDADVTGTVADTVAGWLFLASVAVAGAAVASRVREYFRPNFEPGIPRDEHLASTARWFDEDD